MQRQSPCNVTMCFISMNLQFMNRSSSSSMHSDLHDIVSFVVSIVLTLIQIRYPSDNLFDKHHRTMVVVMSSLLIYCLAFGVLSRSDTTFGDSTTEYNWCCIAMVVFGSVSVAALLSLLFPHSKPLLYLLWVGQLLLVLGLLRKLALQLVTKTLSPLRMRRSRLLPVTSSDVSPPVFNIGYRYWNNQPPPIFNIESRY